jgi:hypothetical protein
VVMLATPAMADGWGGREDADAASVIANVDVRPGVTRDKILNGNPFMKNFTAKDLKTWAELKMQGLNLASRDRD